MKVSIKTALFTPFLILLILFPIASYLIFNFTAGEYVNNSARENLIRLSLVVEQAAERSFIKPAESTFFSSEELNALQAEDFLRSFHPREMKQSYGNAEILIMDHDLQPIYPRHIQEQESAEMIYEFFLTKTNEGALAEEYGKVEQRAIDDQSYLIYVSKASFQNGRSQYIIVYSPVEDLTPLIGQASFFVFLIAIAFAFVFLSVSWALGIKMSKTMKHIGATMDHIANREYEPNHQESSIREIETLYDKMNQMAIRLELEEKAQKTFFQNASHELRTPLMSLRGYAEALELGVLKDTKNAYQIITKESLRLTNLVDQILMLSRMDSRKISMDKERIDITEFLSGYLTRMEVLALEKGVHVQLENPEEPLFVLADEELLTQALINLLSNSIRYAKSEVVVKIAKKKQNVQISIRDDGDGFLTEMLPHLFDRFYRGRDGNIGLGLAIAKSAVHLIGGDIFAKNEQIGAVFEVVLPISS